MNSLIGTPNVMAVRESMRSENSARLLKTLRMWACEMPSVLARNSSDHPSC